MLSVFDAPTFESINSAKLTNDGRIQVGNEHSQEQRNHGQPEPRAMRVFHIIAVVSSTGGLLAVNCVIRASGLIFLGIIRSRVLSRRLESLGCLMFGRHGVGSKQGAELLSITNKWNDGPILRIKSVICSSCNRSLQVPQTSSATELQSNLGQETS